MKNRFAKGLTSLLRFEGSLLFNIFVVISSLATTALVFLYDFEIKEDHILLALRITPPLVALFAIITCILLVVFRSRIKRLLRTLHAIANGNFVITEAEKADGEYGPAYENLSRMVDELQASKQEMQHFTNEFLHEFKTPITAIHGFAEYLIATGEGIETPDRMKYLKIISDESIRLSDLSQKNLMLAKVDACQIITNKDNYDLSEQLKNCIILLLPQIEKKNIELELEVEGLRYYGNAELMEQVWLNLLSNAIKFTPEHGEISIRGQSDDRGITLVFADSGCGMDEETRVHIFEKYYQGASSRQKGGNGIGLSIVHRIISLCGGTITVDSSPDAGSRFTVHLPQNRS